VRLSVVVATHNRASDLAKLLDGLAAQERPAEEIVVVDDGSADATGVVLNERAGDGA
jgi:glycosyltransferase involved in cell wall biosynthesis